MVGSGDVLAAGREPSLMRRERKAMKKGDVEDFPGMRLICGGEYWDWPLWRRFLATLLYKPLGHWTGLKVWFRRLRHRPWAEHMHRNPKRFCPSPREYYKLGYGIRSSNVRPIWYECDFKDKDPDPQEEPHSG